jgi:colicin import membrane protein
VEPDPREAEIALKAKEEQERKRREEAERAKAEAEKRKREAEEKQKAEAEKRKREAEEKKEEERKLAEARARQQRETEALMQQAEREAKARAEAEAKARAAAEAKARAEAEARAKVQAENAARARAEGDWIRRIQAKVRGNVILPPELPGNPEAIFEVVQLPTGEILDVQLRKSSGVRAYDEAVQRAILKSSPLPRPDRPDLFQRTLTLKFRPVD